MVSRLLVSVAHLPVEFVLVLMYGHQALEGSLHYLTQGGVDMHRVEEWACTLLLGVH